MATGFGTAKFSLPINLACIMELDVLEVVDLVRKEWNQLETMIIDWNKILGEAEERGMKTYAMSN